MTDRHVTERTALYLRVSTAEQTTENQRLELMKLAELRGWQVLEVYEDAGISGAKGRDKRPELDRLLRDAAKRKFDRVLVWSVDRLGRSTAQVAVTMEELRQSRVNLFCYRESMDSSTAHGQAMLEMAAVFAKLERSMIQERVKAGLARAKAQGKTLGRPRVVDGKLTDAVLAAKAEGMSVRGIAARVGVSVGTVHALVRGA